VCPYQHPKRIFGGKYSNHQKARILKESPLIEVYKNVRIQLEQMFSLEHMTTRHSPPKMEKTFAKLAAYMAKEKANEAVSGRKSKYSIPDVMGKGMIGIMMKGGIDEAPEWENLADDTEVEDGDLDV
jgi:hypothetical protein